MPTPNTRGDSVRYSVTLSPSIASALDRHCAETSATPSEVIRLALVDRLRLDEAAVTMGKRGPKPGKTKAKRDSVKSAKKV